MRFLITAGVGEQRPATDAAPPSEELIEAYMKFNEDLTLAGVLITSEGLNPQGARARVVVRGGKRVLTDGPFAETKELLGGLYLIEVASKEEAVSWALRCPVGLGTDEVLEIYQMTSDADLPPGMLELIQRVAPTWCRNWAHPVRG